jgi:thiol-disulfide isomerase/thioredoxin
LIIVLAATALAQRPGQEAPGFRLYDTAGEVVELAGLRGKPVILNFWATWCTVCRAEFPHLHAEKLKLGGEVHFLAVNLGEPPALARRFMEEHGYTFRTLVNPPPGATGVDDTTRVARAYRVIGQPMTIFIDADGIVRVVHQGFLGAAQFNTYLRRVGL